MKTYINRRPPWGWPRPEYRLYVVLTDAEAEQLGRDSLLMRREIHDHANKVLIKHGGVACVPFYDARGKLLKVINREQ
jgi:hypothetical protein